MGQTSKTLGTPSTFSHGGKEYKISPATYGIIGEFEAYLQDQAMRTLKRMRKYLSDEEFGLLASKTRRDIDTGVYTFGSEEVKRALDSHVHYAYFVLLCLRENHPELTYEQARDLVKEAGEVIAERMAEVNSDPTKTPVSS